MPQVPPPDGGWGWVVCFACFITHILTDGIFYSFGIIFVELLDYYDETKGTTAIIASLAFGICFLSGPITAALSNHFGNKQVVVAGTCIMVASLVSSIFVSKMVYLFFTFAVTGFGFGMVFLPSIVCVTKYFDTKRAFAVGLSVSGSGVGTFLMSPLTRVLVDAYTWKGAILIQSGLMLNCIACGLVYLPLDHPINNTNKQHCIKECSHIDDSTSLCVNVDTNNVDTSTACVSTELETLVRQTDTDSQTVTTDVNSKPGTGEDKQPGLGQELVRSVRKSFNFRVFTCRRFVLYTISTLFYGLGFYVPYVYMPAKAQYAGIDKFRSAWIISTIGIANTAGRILFGFISDKKCINRVMLYSSAMMLCGVGTLMCPLFNTFETMILYATIFGLFSGVTVSLTAVIIADFVGTEMLTDAMGVMHFFSGISIFSGPPLAGWLFDITNSFDWTFAAAGIAITTSGAMMFAVPLLKDQRPENSK